jgi:hypothetical protein
MCLTYSGIKILVLRKTYQELINNHINEMRAKLYGIAKYSASEKMFQFPNGSTIKFGYCANDGDLDQYMGVECDVVFFDEASQFQEMWIRRITASVRGANNFPKRFYYTLNPGGPSHGYFLRLFINRTYNDGEDPEEYKFIQSKVTDNHALMEAQPDYIKQLQALPYKLRMAWLEGDWSIYEGQFFEEFRDDPAHYADRMNTHVIEPFDLSKGEPATWTIYRSFDWGYNKPFACCWWAVDRDGTVYNIMELYGCAGEPDVGVKWTDDVIFSKIKEIETTHPYLKGKHINGVADPSIWGKGTGSGISTAETAAQHGVHFQKGDNDRIAGWMQWHYRLQFDSNGYPRMYFFKTCKHMIRTIPLQMYDETHVEDLDTKLEEHLQDSGRYFLMARPIKPIIEQELGNLLFDPLNQYTRNNPTRRGA